MNPWSLTGLLVGVAYGYASQRGAFCMNSGFRVAVTRRDFTKVKAFLLAVAIQAVALPALFALGQPRPAAMPFQPVGAVAGGAVFGAAMGWAGGCAAGAWYKLGSGNLAALFAFAGIALGAGVLDAGSGVALRAALSGPNLAVGTLPSWLPPAAGVVLLAGLATARPGSAGAWSWRRTGLVVGLVGLAAWPLSAWAGRRFGLAVVPGAAALLRAPLDPAGALGSWDVLFVLGIPAGACIAARREGPVGPRFATRPEFARAFAGGVALGAGASLAGGCTVGHGLAGLPLLFPQSVLTMAAIFAGSALASIWRERSTERESRANRRVT